MTGDERIERLAERVQRGVNGFAEEMRAKGIHVGLGKPGRCVTCDEPWPCSQGAPR